MIQPLQFRGMKSILCWKVYKRIPLMGNQFKIHSNVFTLLFLKINWNRFKEGRWSGLWDSLSRRFGIHPPVPSLSRPRHSKQKDEGEEERKGQEGQEVEEITPVYREVLGAVFDGAAVSQQEQDHDHHHHHHPGWRYSSDDEEDSSCGIKGAPQSPPAMGFCEGFADRVAQMSCFTTFRIPYIYDMILACKKKFKNATNHF